MSKETILLNQRIKEAEKQVKICEELDKELEKLKNKKELYKYLKKKNDENYYTYAHHMLRLKAELKIQTETEQKQIEQEVMQKMEKARKKATQQLEG